MKNNKLRSLAISSPLLFLATSPAFAAIDTSFVADMQADIIAAVTAIMTALLVAGGTVVAYKWAKASLFG